MYPSWTVTEMDVTEQEIIINSDSLKREVTITLLLPENYERSEPLNLLLLNDGQEADNLKLKETFETLYNTCRIKPVLVAAIHANEERVQEYGVAGKPDYKLRGSKAAAYTKFITTELLPAIKKVFGFFLVEK
jgi:enterochelin esterase family protein